MSWAIAAAAAAPIIGGIAGNLMGAGDRKKAMQLIKKGVAELKAAGFPPDLSTPLLLRQFQEIGIMTPELEQDIQIAASEVAELEEDPILRNSQLEALNVFKQMGRTGFGPEERAAYNQMRQQQQQDLQSRLASQDLEAQRRGMAQAGDTRAQQLLSIQAGADRASMEGDRLSAMLSERIREGATGMSNVASGIRGQDYQAELARRQAKDLREQFRAENAMARQMRNVGALNERQQREEQQAMQVATANTQQFNAEQGRQLDAQRQYWKDKLDRATALANAYSGQSTALQNQAANTASMWSGIGSGIGQGFGAYSQAQSDNRKNDIAAAKLDQSGRDYLDKLKRQG
jgi:hypothetical protein